MYALNQDIVQKLWEQMDEHFESRTRNKADAPEMVLIGEVLDAGRLIERLAAVQSFDRFGILENAELVSMVLQSLGLPSKEEFLENYATTIGSTIYVPFEIGVGTQAELVHQVCLCAHEHQHVVQAREAGFVNFAARYLTNSSLRAAYEAEAFRCNLELAWYLTERIPKPRLLAEVLRAYMCSDGDIDVTEQALEMVAKVVKKGGIVSEASKIAIEFLDDPDAFIQKKKVPLEEPQAPTE